MKFGDHTVHRPDEPLPVEMTEEDIQRAIRDWVEAAKKAVNVAGFDGVEIHGTSSSPIVCDGFFLTYKSAIRSTWFLGGPVHPRRRQSAHR
jgi:hypothetical protein